MSKGKARFVEGVAVHLRISIVPQVNGSIRKNEICMFHLLCPIKNNFDLKRFMEHSSLGGKYIPISESKSIVEPVVRETPPSSVSASWAPIAAAAADCSSNSWC
jgi:hypothetical protein